MEYKACALELLHKLGIQKMYKGCEYVISSIKYISENEAYFTPVSKVLYVEIAKQYNTSGICVEKNIRSIIKKIWSNPYNAELLEDVFGKQYKTKSPSNINFLMLVYNHSKKYIDNTNSATYSNEDYSFICPLSGNSCEFCREFLIEKLHNDET